MSDQHENCDGAPDGGHTEKCRMSGEPYICEGPNTHEHDHDEWWECSKHNVLVHKDYIVSLRAKCQEAISKYHDEIRRGRQACEEIVQMELKAQRETYEAQINKLRKACQLALDNIFNKYPNQNITPVPELQDALEESKPK